MARGDDIVAGRVTGANSTTIVVGERPDDENPPDFNGDFVLIAGPTENGNSKPIHATGQIPGGGNGQIPHIPRGTGITGVGGANQGTGVFGVGGNPGDTSGAG